VGYKWRFIGQFAAENVVLEAFEGEKELSTGSANVMDAAGRFF
jgi:hypothetical protein